MLPREGSSLPGAYPMSTLNDNLARIVMLTYGRMEDGKSPYWCYVAIKPSEYERFNTTLKGGALDPKQFENDGYGEIVVSGPGLYPPADVTRGVAGRYNMPIQELFGKMDPQTLIAQKIQQLKKTSEGD